MHRAGSVVALTFDAGGAITTIAYNGSLVG